MAQAARSKRLSFIKMHGLGNDFAVFDARDGIFALDPDVVQAIAARRTGIGFDQLITLLPSARADVFMAIQNADGSEAAACGNATRCVADLLIEETGKDTVTIETRGGHATARAVRHAGRRAIRVDMGPPQLEWRQIPLAREVDTLHLNLTSGRLSDPVAVGIGNPHVVFFVNDLRVVDITKAGPRFETDPLFPNGVNVSVAQVPRVNLIRLKVWERGVRDRRLCRPGGGGAARPGAAQGGGGDARRQAGHRLERGQPRADDRTGGDQLQGVHRRFRLRQARGGRLPGRRSHR